jgi:hypothetical protein
LQQVAASLERSQKADSLNSRLARRPSREELISKHILEIGEKKLSRKMLFPLFHHFEHKFLPFFKCEQLDAKMEISFRLDFFLFLFKMSKNLQRNNQERKSEQ